MLVDGMDPTFQRFLDGCADEVTTTNPMPRIPPAQVADLYADHCYTRVCYTRVGLHGQRHRRPGLERGPEDWGLEANLAWLHSCVDG